MLWEMISTLDLQSQTGKTLSGSIELRESCVEELREKEEEEGGGGGRGGGKREEGGSNCMWHI